MSSAVAFLRAVNVGGRTVLKEQLLALFASAGLRDVETFLASGNVIFSAPKGSLAQLERRLESHLAAELGITVDLFLRSMPDVATIAAAQPFAPNRLASATAMTIGLLHAPLGAAAIKALMAHASAVDDFAVDGTEVRWLCQTRQSESPFFKVPFERLVGAPATWRNRNTFTRIAARFSA